MSVPLPSSDQAPYHAGYWAEIEEKLTKLRNNPTADLLKKTVLRFLNQTKLDRDKYIANCPTAKEIMDHDELKTLTFTLEKQPDIEPAVIKTICGIALELPTLFPSKDLKILKKEEEDKVILTRRQVACLVTHMFFCTVLPCSNMRRQGYVGHFVGDAAPTGPITFRYWLTSFHNPTKLYLKALMTYFTELSKTDLNILDKEHVTFSRKYLEETPLWEQSITQIVKITPDLAGRIGDVAGHVEMDFANKHVGFGTTGTQEELLLGTSLESTPVVLFNEVLLEKDALLIQGVKKDTLYKGYAFSVKYAGVPENNEDRVKRKILAMDAYCYIGDEKVQLQSQHMKRELNKAYCAFSMVPSSVVDSGHWGCGAFGGNKGLKAILQVMAASEAKLEELVFYSFGDTEFNENFQAVLKLVEEKKPTVGDLWKYLKEYEKCLETVDQSGVGCLKFLKKVLN